MDDSDDIFQHCHVDLNDDGDRFVGIKGDHNNLMVYFPCGYELPNDENEVRQEIRDLFNVLAEFTTEDDRVLEIDRNAATISVSFPIQAYRTVIEYYLERQKYYSDNEIIYKRSDSGPINFAMTFKKSNPIILPNSSTFMFDDYFRMQRSPQKNQMITRIHKFCVYESFKKLGIIYTPLIPEKPDLMIDPKDQDMINSCINLLYEKLYETRNDVDNRLFEAMINMLRYYGSNNDEKQYYFGTDKFEHVWERLIDKVFGVSKEEKQKYFPRAYWRVFLGRDKKYTSSAFLAANLLRTLLDCIAWSGGVVALETDQHPRTFSNRLAAFPFCHPLRNLRQRVFVARIKGNHSRTAL